MLLNPGCDIYLIDFMLYMDLFIMICLLEILSPEFRSRNKNLTARIVIATRRGFMAGVIATVDILINSTLLSKLLAMNKCNYRLSFQAGN